MCWACAEWIKPLNSSVVGAGPDSVCLTVRVLLWSGGLNAGWLTQIIAVACMGSNPSDGSHSTSHLLSEVPASTANLQRHGRHVLLMSLELIVLHYSCLEFLSGCPQQSRQAKIIGQGGPRSGAKADLDWGPRWTKHWCEGQGGHWSGI